MLDHVLFLNISEVNLFIILKYFIFLLIFSSGSSHRVDDSDLGLPTLVASFFLFFPPELKCSNMLLAIVWEMHSINEHLLRACYPQGIIQGSAVDTINPQSSANSIESQRMFLWLWKTNKKKKNPSPSRDLLPFLQFSLQSSFLSTPPNPAPCLLVSLT